MRRSEPCREKRTHVSFELGRFRDDVGVRGAPAAPLHCQCENKTHKLGCGAGPTFRLPTLPSVGPKGGKPPLAPTWLGYKIIHPFYSFPGLLTAVLLGLAWCASPVDNVLYEPVPQL